MQQLKSNPALILIDIQKGFDDLGYWGGSRNNPDAEKKARKLLDVWRQKSLPLFHIQHSSSNPASILAETSAGHAFKEIVLPFSGETVIQKNVNSAFIGTSLKELLDQAEIKTVIIVGLTTDHCVSTTARMAANFGYQTIVVSDATASFAKNGIQDEHYDADTIHLTALAHLKGEFATILNADQVIYAVDAKTKSPQEF